MRIYELYNDPNDDVIVEKKKSSKKKSSKKKSSNAGGDWLKKLCKSSRSNKELGASNLAACKSRGLRAREGGKSHKIGKTRVKVDGKKIPGEAHGGPLPDYS